MKHFDARAILADPKLIMQYMGVWPDVNASVSYKIRGLVGFILSSLIMILLLWKGLKDLIEGDYENGTYVMSLMLIGGHVVFKIWFLLTNTPLFFEILTNLEDPSLLYHDDNFDSYLQDKIQSSKRLFNALVIMCTSTALVIIMSEYAFGYKTSPRILAINTDPSHLISYISVWLLLTVTVLYAGLIISTFEGLVLTLLSLGIAQLQVLQKEIISAVDLYPSDIILAKEEIQYYDKIVNTALSKSVKRHNAIERYIASIETKFSIEFLMQFCITLCVTGLLGVNFIFASIPSSDFIKCVCIFLGDLIPVFLIYYHCNEIILESENVKDACYTSNWYVCGPSVRKTLFIIMERTKRPFYLTIGKFAIISIDMFVTILKTSMSYFTVLKSMYIDDPNIK